MSATPQQRHKQNGRSALTTIEASNQSGLSHSYIWQLLRSGRIEGKKIGRDWLVYEDSLQAFLTQPRSPGRKGPRKRRIEKHDDQGNHILLSTAEASDLSGYRQDYLLRLLHKNQLEGEKSGRTWLIYEDSLLAYKNRQPRKHPTIPSMSDEPPLPSDG